MSADITLIVSNGSVVTGPTPPPPPTNANPVARTIAGLRLLNTATGNIYYTSGNGGGPWQDIGLNDGQYEDNTGTYLVTANNHVLKRSDSSGMINVEWFEAVPLQDSTSAINAAYAAAVQAKQPIYLPGIYLYSGVLDIDEDLVVILGAGADKSGIRLTTANSRILVRHKETYTGPGAGRSIYRTTFMNWTLNGMNTATNALELYRTEEVFLSNFICTNSAEKNIRMWTGGLLHMIQVMCMNSPIAFDLESVGQISGQFLNIWNTDTPFQVTAGCYVAKFSDLWVERFTTFLKVKGNSDGQCSLGTFIVDGNYLCAPTDDNTTYADTDNASLLRLEGTTHFAISEGLEFRGTASIINSTAPIFDLEGKTDTISFFKFTNSLKISSSTNNPQIIKFGANATAPDYTWMTLSNFVNTPGITLSDNAAFLPGGSLSSYNMNMFPNGISLTANPTVGRFIYDEEGNLSITNPNGVPVSIVDAGGSIWVSDDAGVSTRVAGDQNVAIGGPTITTARLKVLVNGKQYGVMAESTDATDPMLTLKANSHIYSLFVDNTSAASFGLIDWTNSAVRLLLSTTGVWNFLKSGLVQVSDSGANGLGVWNQIKNSGGNVLHGINSNTGGELIDGLAYSYFVNASASIQFAIANNALISILPTGMGIGTIAPAASAKLQIDSTTQGFLPPRMTTAQRTAIATPQEGLYVYDTDLHKPFTWDGTTWQAHY